MKKISSILIIVILCNFIFPRFAYADNNTVTYSEEAYNQLESEGTISINTENGSVTEELNNSQSSMASMIGTQTSAVASVFLAVSGFIRIIVNQGGLYYTDSEYSAEKVGWFSVCSLVFGEYLLFNANVYQLTSDLNPSITPSNVSSIMDGIKEFALAAFQLFKYFAIAFILLMLIFTVLRLSVSDLAVDRARYKTVLKAWAVGLIFIIALPFIIVFINTVCDSLMDILWDARTTLEEADYTSFENELYLESVNGVAETGGLKSAAYFIEFLAFLIMQIKFIGKYLKRLAIALIYVALSPIIGVGHIFAILSGKEVGLIGRWISKYTTNMLMQPLHALLYLIFTFGISEIAVKAPLLAVLFLWALSRAEKIFTVILQIDFGSSIKSIFSK